MTSKRVAFLSEFSFHTISESVLSEQVADVGSKGQCSSHQANETLSSVRTARGRSGTDSLKTM